MYLIGSVCKEMAFLVPRFISLTRSSQNHQFDIIRLCVSVCFNPPLVLDLVSVVQRSKRFNVPLVVRLCLSGGTVCVF